MKGKTSDNAYRKLSSSQCPYTGKCGGCSNTGIGYDEQLKKKQTRIAGLFKDIDRKVDDIVGSEQPFHYRNKVHSVFSRDKKGNVIRGMYAQDSHDVINVSGCLLENETADAIINEVKRLASVYKMKIYDEDAQTGFLRHVLVRVAQYHGKEAYMVVIVTSQVQFEGKNNFIKLLRLKFPAIITIVQNINNKRTSMVLGDRNIVIYGKGYVVDDSLGFEFRISPSAFFQINSTQTGKLYKLALEMAAPQKNDTVLDAYCGTGTIGMFLSRVAGRVIGVELNPDAVKDAVENAKLNKIDNIEFICADATKYIQELAAGSNIVPDILCMDPPRSGSTPEFIDAAAALKIPRIVYVSCDPETLARDVKLFVKHGYRPKRIVPVDMFPQTDHVETICLLSNLSKS
ncbi:MAG: 23S rRNA (uracil(1939)-C(5))-methyltransferase RlmD [Lachnospiraceae bacterium]|nr:23S rRNA (uracil(1939)-C(5))-methyltransferase RlmD [Lachnospiraceae bacterium]